MASLPYWSDSASLPTFPKLDRDTDADVVVIGGGITGLTTAYLLAAGGRSVVAARARPLRRGRHRSHQRAPHDGHRHAADRARGALRPRLTRRRCGTRAAPPSRRSTRSCASTKSTARSSGSTATCTRRTDRRDADAGRGVSRRGAAGVRARVRRGLHDHRAVRRRARASASTIRRASTRAGISRAWPRRSCAAGGRIFEHSEAEEFRDEPLAVKANGHWVACQDIVIATHNPLVGVASIASATLFQTKLALYTSYVVAGRVPRGHRSRRALLGYRRSRITTCGSSRTAITISVIVGGEDHKTGQAPSTIAPASIGSKQAHPGPRAGHRVHAPVVGSGDRDAGRPALHRPDGRPSVRRDRVRRQRHDVRHAGGDDDRGRDSRSARIRGPISSIPGASAVRRGLWDYVKENTDYPYYMLRDRFAGAEGQSLRAVKRGQGQVIEHHGEKVAAYPRLARRADAALGGLHAHGLPGGVERRGAARGTARATARASRRRAR